MGAMKKQAEKVIVALEGLEGQAQRRHSVLVARI